MKFIIDHSELTGKQLKAQPVPEQDKKDNSHCFYNIINPSNKIQCDDCKRDISKGTKILAQNSDFCISCYSNLDLFPDDYHVINKQDYPLFDQHWTADEELMLFEGLEKHGFGNWTEIAEFIGTNKTREDVEEHYVTYFLDSPDFMPTASVITQRDQTGKLISFDSEGQVKKFQRPVSRIFSSHSVQSFQRGSLTVNQMTAGKTGTNPSEIVGYMPKRGDFEVQFDNDAQLLLAEMEFNQDDSPEEKQMKFRLIDIYNHKLNERIRRKEFVISRKLLDLKEQIRLDKTRNKEEKQIYNMMKVFARFSSPEQHERLVQGIIKEKQIRAKLQQLQDMKDKGFRSLADLQEELEGKKRKEERKLRRQDPIFLASERSRSSAPPDFRPKRSKKETMVEKGVGRPDFGPEEQQICARFNIRPEQFWVLKDNLIRESVRQGVIDLDVTTKLFKFSRQTVERVVDFLVQKEELMGVYAERQSGQLF